jgi:hypothetical protein
MVSNLKHGCIYIMFPKASLGITHSPARDLPDQRSGGVTIKGRHPDGSSADTPGPGAYDVSPTQTGGFSMAGRYPDHKGDGGPGPGAYAHGWLRHSEPEAKCRCPEWFSLPNLHSYLVLP